VPTNLLVLVSELEPLLGDGLHLLALVVGHVLDGVLVDRVRQVQHLHVLSGDINIIIIIIIIVVVVIIIIIIAVVVVIIIIIMTFWMAFSSIASVR
jgi:hypothetical protein